jgi:nucleoside-diphosphate-sugar epimerase
LFRKVPCNTWPVGFTFAASERCWRVGPVADHDWDFVLDVARQPLHVSGALAALAGRTRHWVFVSTCSVYADDSTPEADETADLHPAWSGEGLAPEESYGPAKVACEQAVLASFPDALVARAGLIVGYGDRSDRFGYWPGRLSRAADGEPVLVPPLDAWCQALDVDDLAAWLVRCGEAGRGGGGVVNATSEPSRLGDVLAACATAAGSTPRWVEATDAWLGEQGVQPWAGPDSLPLWLPQQDYAGFMRRSTTRARAAGLVTRSGQESARAALRWERELGVGRVRSAGLAPACEAGLLRRLDG